MMPWYTTEHARRDALMQAARQERTRCGEEIGRKAANLEACPKSSANSAAISALKAAAAELIATGCSSLCAVGEPCGVTGGQCAALTPKEGNNW